MKIADKIKNGQWQK